MIRSVLILRPQPGAVETAARAEALGFVAVVAPLFTIRPVAWSPPDPTTVRAIVMTSANAARTAGPALRALTGLPLFAVGAATAAAARAAGFARIQTGTWDAATLAAQIVAAGVSGVLHLAGEDHRPLGLAQATTRIVYRSEPTDELPAAAIAAACDGALALLHSPRAARVYRRLVERAGLDPSRLRIVAISKLALAAAGWDWGQAAAADAPRDDALLAAAARLCDQ